MKKITTMTIKEIQEEIESNDEKRSDLFKQQEPIERKLVKLAKRNEKLNDQIATIRAKEKSTDWNWLLETKWNESSMEKYHLREQKLRELNLRSSGYFRQTNQVQIQIALIKNDKESLPATLKGLKKMLKYIKPVEGYKRIDIMESTLSEHGVWELHIDEEKSEYLIHLTRYHRPEVVHKCDNLKTALEKIQHDYYYEDKDKEDSYAY